MIPDLPNSASCISFMYEPPALVQNYFQRPNDTLLEGMVFHRPTGEGAMWSEIEETKTKIHEFSSMEENWDGYGALKITKKTGENAISAVDAILRHAPAPDLSPNPNGTISMEWETDRGVAHLEVGRTRFSFYLRPRTGAPSLLDGKTDHIPADIGAYISAMLFQKKSQVNTMTKIKLSAYAMHSY